MVSFKKIKTTTILQPGTIIREFNQQKNDFENYVIGNHKLEDDAYEVYPEGVDFLNKNSVLFYYPKSKMIARNCEFYDK